MDEAQNNPTPAPSEAPVQANTDSQTATPQPIQEVRYALPTAPSLLSWSFSFYSTHFALIAGIAVVPFLLGLLSAVGTMVMSPLMVSLLALPLAIVTYLSSLALIAAVSSEQATVMSAYKRGFSLVLASLWVTTLVVIATMGGAFLFIIPGIVISVLLGFSLYVLYSENIRGKAALVASWNYVRGYGWAVFGRSVFFGLLVLLAMIVLSIATGGFNFQALSRGMAPSPDTQSLFSQIANLVFSSFLVTPLSTIYMFSLYRAVREAKQTTPATADDVEKTSRRITIFSIIGVVGFVVIILLGMFLAIAVATRQGAALPGGAPQGGMPAIGPSGASAILPVLELLAR